MKLLSSTENGHQSQFYMFSHHVDRLIAAAHAFHWPDASTLVAASSLETAIRAHLGSAHREKESYESLKVLLQAFVFMDSEFEDRAYIAE